MGAELIDAHLGEAVPLLRTVVPDACSGLTPYDSPRFDAFLRSAIGVPARHRTLFARGVVEDGRLAAVADWRLVGEVFFLNGIAAAPDCRGRGLGRRLLTDGLELAAKWGCTAVELDVGRDNEPAQRLYDGMGFVPRDGAVWADLPVPDSGSATVTPEADLPWRIRNWPVFSALMAAYGFADLELACTDPVRRTPAEAVSVRVLPDGWRMSGVRDAAAAWALADALSESVGGQPKRLFTVVDEGACLPPGAGEIGSFRRLRRGLRQTGRESGGPAGR